MMRKIIFLAAGSIAFICGCMVVLNARNWLVSWQEIHIAEGGYFLATFTIMMVTNFSAAIIISAAFRFDAREFAGLQTTHQALHANNSESSEPVNTYRHPYRSICFAIIISTASSVSPLIPGNSTKPPPLAAYLIGFCISAILLPYIVYFIRFRISISQKEIVITTFSTKKFPTANIVNVRYNRTGVILETTIKLRDKRKYTIIGALKDHYQLADTLNACVGKGRWTSSDWWITRHFKEMASRATPIEEADKNKIGH